MPKQADIVLVNVPFSDLQSSKKRPVLIISNDNYNNKQNDIIVAAITSNLTSKDYAVEFDDNDMNQGTIQHKSCVRADKVYTLDKKLIVKTFGTVSDDILTRTTQMVGKVIAKYIR